MAYCEGYALGWRFIVVRDYEPKEGGRWREPLLGATRR